MSDNGKYNVQRTKVWNPHLRNYYLIIIKNYLTLHIITEGDGREEINALEEKSREEEVNNDASGSESSEGGEDIDAYKYDDFVVPEADEGEAMPKKKKKGHKRKHKEIRALDESDLDLIEENTGMRVNRPRGPPPRKFRRLVRGDNEEEAVAEPVIFDDDEIRFDEGSFEGKKSLWNTHMILVNHCSDKLIFQLISELCRIFKNIEKVCG